MSERELAVQLLDSIPDYKLGYVVSYLQGYLQGMNESDEIPNEETLKAFEESDEIVKKGTGQRFDGSTEDFFKAMLEDWEMLKLSSTTRFSKDIKICSKRNYNLRLLYNVVNILRSSGKLPAANKDHSLVGNYANRRECHILPDWLLIYKVEGDELILERTGTHSDLFGK